MKSWYVGPLCFGILLFYVECPAASKPARASISKESAACVDCHRTQSASLVMEWEHSAHSRSGIGCWVLDLHARDAEGLFRMSRG
jgi:hypothetical protein